MYIAYPKSVLLCLPPSLLPISFPLLFFSNLLSVRIHTHEKLSQPSLTYLYDNSDSRMAWDRRANIGVARDKSVFEINRNNGRPYLDRRRLCLMCVCLSAGVDGKADEMGLVGWVGSEIYACICYWKSPVFYNNTYIQVRDFVFSSQSIGCSKRNASFELAAKYVVIKLRLVNKKRHTTEELVKIVKITYKLVWRIFY